MAEDEFLEALTTLEEVLADNGRRASLIKKRIAQLRRLRSKGASYTELVSTDAGPLIVQLLTASSTALDTSGANVRRAEAQALYAEGLTMEDRGPLRCHAATRLDAPAQGPGMTQPGPPATHPPRAGPRTPRPAHVRPLSG